MVSAKLSRDIIFHSALLNPWTQRQHSSSSAEWFWQGRVGSWPSVSCLAKAGGAPVPPAGSTNTLSRELGLYPWLRGNKTEGVVTPTLPLGARGVLNFHPTSLQQGSMSQGSSFAKVCWQGLEAKHTYPAAHVLNLNRGLPALKEKEED